MKVKSDFIHDVIKNNCKITPKFFYWAKRIQTGTEPQDDVWLVSRTENENVYCRPDLKFIIADESKIERIGLYTNHCHKY